MAKPEDPAPMVVKTLEVDYTSDGRPLHATGQDPQVVSLVDSLPCPETAAVQESTAGRLVLAAVQPGHYQLRTALGRVLQADMPPPIMAPLAGPWDVSFRRKRSCKSGRSSRKHRRGSWSSIELISWSEHADPGVKYYSGTATYRKTFDVPAALSASPRAWIWATSRSWPSAAQRPGPGHLLETALPRRRDRGRSPGPTAGNARGQPVDQPPDRRRAVARRQHRNADGITLKPWPQWLLDGKPSPTGRHTFTSHRLWKKDDPLQESGLIGPVRLRAVKCAELAGP